jgi:hypothetical protein
MRTKLFKEGYRIVKIPKTMYLELQKIAERKVEGNVHMIIRMALAEYIEKENNKRLLEAMNKQ